MMGIIFLSKIAFQGSSWKHQIETDDEDPEKETAMNRSSAKDRLVFPDCQKVGYASGDIPDNQKEEAEVKG